MYIFKNAIRCICRSKVRNVLIGIIVLVIAVSACLGLSIRQAAESAREQQEAGLSITATISFDRQSMMGSMGRPGDGKFEFDRDQFAELMGNASSLTKEEYKTYATVESVDDFYYTLTASVNGSETLEPVTNESESNSNEQGNGRKPGGMMGGMFQGVGNSGDFSLVGYSGDNAMTDFRDGITAVTDGAVFEQGTSEYTCIISSELATYNSLVVGDSITVTAVENEEETYTLTVSGIYESTETNEFSGSRFGAGQDPANRIYMSAAALETLIAASEEAAGEEGTPVSGMMEATYVFKNVEDYEAFDGQARALGLDDSYTISSMDMMNFENSLTPLKTLSTMAGWFLLVILAIGAVILVVLNIFNVRERKYEIGVLTAMGMKKSKVAMQFMSEILVVTMLAVALGAGIGAVSSVPVTNALLANQIENSQAQDDRWTNSFGRPNDMGGDRPSFGGAPNMPGDEGGRNPFSQMMGGAVDYVSDIDSAMNLTVVFQMLGIGLLLTLVAGAASVLFVMRYDPLKILANRD